MANKYKVGDVIHLKNLDDLVSRGLVVYVCHNRNCGNSYSSKPPVPMDSHYTEKMWEQARESGNSFVITRAICDYTYYCEYSNGGPFVSISGNSWVVNKWMIDDLYNPDDSSLPV